LRGSVPPGGGKSWEGVKRSENAENWFSKWGASGLAAVWAEENTRESIFGAMRNKETYATSGPRIKLRMFGGYNYTPNMLGDADMVSQAYAGGVATLPALMALASILKRTAVLIMAQA